MSARAEAGARGRITARAVVLAAVVLVLGVASFAPVRSFLAQREEIDRLEQQITDLRAERTELQAELERIRDPEYLERIARQCLGMVKPGEIAFANPQGPRSEAC